MHVEEGGGEPNFPRQNKKAGRGAEIEEKDRPHGMRARLDIAKLARRRSYRAAVRFSVRDCPGNTRPSGRT